LAIYTIQDSNALLLYRVGPVLVCSTTMPVESVIMPPRLTVPPGANTAEPGVFKSIHGIVRLVDLRVRFGVEKEDYTEPGRIVVVEVEGGHAGFWVDEIEDVIGMPEKGWVNVPAHIPTNVFTRALLQNEDIRLYADFEQLDKLKTLGYLRKHIEVLKKGKEGLKSVNDRNKSLNKTPRLVNERQTSINVPDVQHEKKFERRLPDAADEKSETKSETRPESKSEVKPETTQPLKFIEKKEQPVNRLSQKQNNTGRTEAEKKSYTDALSQQEKRARVYEEVINRREDKLPDKKNIQADVPDSLPDTYKVHIDEEKSSSLVWPVSVFTVFAIAVYFIVLPFVMFDGDEPKKNNSPKEIKRYIEMVDAQSGEVTGMHGDILDVAETGEGDVSEVIKEQTVLIEKTHEIEVFQKPEEKFPEKIENESVNTENKPVESGNVEILKNDEGLLIVVNEFQELDEQEIVDLDVNDRVIEVKAQTTESDKAQVVQMPGELTREKSSIEAGAVKDGSVESINEIIVFKQSKTVVESDNEYSEKVGGQRLNSDVDVVKNENINEDKIAIPAQIVNIRRIRSEKFIHVVVKNDTLWYIAKKYVHNPWRYPELARLSNIKNPDLIYPGDRVTIIINYQRKH
jgi:chemotaxis signal transduction protein/LysM repeat protein